MANGSGFRVQSSEFRVQSSGFRVQSSEFRVQNSEFRVRPVICTFAHFHICTFSHSPAHQGSRFLLWVFNRWPVVFFEMLKFDIYVKGLFQDVGKLFSTIH